MAELLSAPRVRYPLRAKVAVALGSLAVLGELAVFSLFIMPLFPLIPVFVAVMFGNALWMSHLFHWATSLAELEPVGKPRVEAATQGGESRQRPQPHAA
jgi:hypothetical protein